MTRLTTDDIIKVAANLADYDAELVAKTGYSLRGMACCAAGVNEADIQNMLGNISVGIIPITSGEGILSGFCDAIKSIVSHIGCKAFITQAADVAGLAESFENNADLIMLADDVRFTAIHLQSRRVVDNAIATGKAYASGLNLMAGGLKGRDVLVIGCGPVGGSTTECLVKIGASTTVYDIDQTRSQDLAERIKLSLNSEIKIEKDLETALTGHQFIIDASPATDIINEHHITSDTYISAPGIPIGLDQEAQLKISNRLLHDPLQIGVATMAMCVLKFHINY